MAFLTLAAQSDGAAGDGWLSSLRTLCAPLYVLFPSASHFLCRCNAESADARASSHHQ